MKIVSAINNLLSDSHLETPLAMQAFEQDENYRHYELWRLNFHRQIKNTIRAIKTPLNISPANLRDALLKQQDELETNVVSPLNYYFYLQRLERFLFREHQLSKGYRYALQEARTGLIEK